MKNNIVKLLFSIFMIVGIVLLIIGAILFINGARFRQSAVPITGEITEIETYRDSDGDRSHRVYAAYTFEGREYERVRLGMYSSSMYVGEEITLLCDPSNPGKVTAVSETYLAGFILFFIGAVFFLVGVIPLIIMLVKDKKDKHLLESGRVLHATVESIDVNRNYMVKGRNPYIIYCTWKDEYADVLYRFKSGSIWTDPESVFPKGSNIDVYVDENDFSKYYVNAEQMIAQRVVDFTI